MTERTQSTNCQSVDGSGTPKSCSRLLWTVYCVLLSTDNVSSIVQVLLLTISFSDIVLHRFTCMRSVPIESRVLMFYTSSTRSMIFILSLVTGSLMLPKICPHLSLMTVMYTTDIITLTLIFSLILNIHTRRSRVPILNDWTDRRVSSTSSRRTCTNRQISFALVTSNVISACTLQTQSVDQSLRPMESTLSAVVDPSVQMTTDVQ